ncbi:hypothetical protein EJ07DRAFT_160661, partial [Lizonia empirigonia]
MPQLPPMLGHLRALADSIVELRISGEVERRGINFWRGGGEAGRDHGENEGDDGDSRSHLEGRKRLWETETLLRVDQKQLPSAFAGSSLTSRGISRGTQLCLPSCRNEFLIVGLFALRLTKTLIEGLPQYPERYGDLAWLAHMLAPFPIDYDLAKLTGEGKRDYLRTYPAVVSRMKRQPGYPLRFMQMNPATVARLDVLHRQGGMTD